jgi:hypothetical protein
MIKPIFTKLWKNTIIYRIALCLAIVLALGRMGLHFLTMRSTLNPVQFPQALTGWWSTESAKLPPDLQVYWDAAERFAEQKDLYSAEAGGEVIIYQYSPAFALLYSLGLLLPLPMVVLLMSILNVAAYVGLFLLWAHLFHRFQMRSALNLLVAILPVWILFSGFWIDLSLLNIHIIISFLASLLLLAVIKERLLISVVLLVLLVQTKPYWAFLLLIPLLLGRYQFFLRLLAYSLLGYLGIVLATSAIGSWSYVSAQYREYMRISLYLSRNYPWRTMQDGFLGYNHAIKQVAYYLFGYSSFVNGIVNLVKQLLFLPLFLVILAYLIRPLEQPGWERPDVALDVAFGVYLGVYVYLDFVWELTLGIIVVIYLLSLEKKGWVRGFLWGVFLLYSLMDLWGTLGFLFNGKKILEGGIFIISNPNIYLPVVLFFLLALYLKMIFRLWRHFPTRKYIQSTREK